MEQLTKEEATKFFSEFYHGEHHIPGHEPKPYGLGWRIDHDRGDLATWDYNDLTRLVLMAHDECIRVGITAEKKNVLRIAIWRRQREGGMSERHPALETAIEKFRQSRETKTKLPPATTVEDMQLFSRKQVKEIIRPLWMRANDSPGGPEMNSAYANKVFDEWFDENI